MLHKNLFARLGGNLLRAFVGVFVLVFALPSYGGDLNRENTASANLFSFEYRFNGGGHAPQRDSEPLQFSGAVYEASSLAIRQSARLAANEGEVSRLSAGEVALAIVLVGGTIYVLAVAIEPIISSR